MSVRLWHTPGETAAQDSLYTQDATDETAWHKKKKRRAVQLETAMVERETSQRLWYDWTHSSHVSTPQCTPVLSVGR